MEDVKTQVLCFSLPSLSFWKGSCEICGCFQEHKPICCPVPAGMLFQLSLTQQTAPSEFVSNGKPITHSGPVAPSLHELSFWDELCLTRETGPAGLEVVG